MTALVNEHCEACRADTPKVEGAAIEELRSQLDPAWKVADGALRRDFRFPDFVHAFRHTAGIALIAESEGHHPDIELGWGRVRVDLVTHAVHGLTRNDFILAAKIDALDH